MCHAEAVAVSGPAWWSQQQEPREQIYAPVAHLQQKIAQRDAAAQQQQMLLQQQQHQLHQPHQQHHQQQQLQHHHSLSPDGDKYGFGMKFQTHQQSHFYQQMVDGGVPMLSPPGEQQQQQVRL